MSSYPSVADLKNVLYEQIKGLFNLNFLPFLDYKTDYEKTLKVIKLELKLREKDNYGRGTKTEKKLLGVFRKWLQDIESEEEGKSLDKYLWFRNTVKNGKTFKSWW